MRKVMMAMIFTALANTVFATNTVELNSITTKDTLALAEEMSINVPEVKSPNIQAKEAKSFTVEDAFEGLKVCSLVNNVFAGLLPLKEAVSMLEPCMKAVSKKYGVTVLASQYLPPQTNAPGIGILVSGPLPPGNPVMIDLNYSVKIIHSGYLLTHPAYVKYLGEIIVW